MAAGSSPPDPTSGEIPQDPPTGQEHHASNAAPEGASAEEAEDKSIDFYEFGISVRNAATLDEHWQGPEVHTLINQALTTMPIGRFRTVSLSVLAPLAARSPPASFKVHSKGPGRNCSLNTLRCSFRPQK